MPRCLVRRNLRNLLESDELAGAANAEGSEGGAEGGTAPVIKLVCHPERRADADGVAPILLGEALADAPAHARVLLAIGPERGWAEPRELDLFERHGFRTVTLGPRTLRTDVAVISLLAVAHERLAEAAQRCK